MIHSALIEMNFDWNAHKRAAMVTYWLMDGQCLSSAEIAELVGMSVQGVEYLMDNLTSRSGEDYGLPFTRINGKWQKVSGNQGGL